MNKFKKNNFVYSSSKLLIINILSKIFGFTLITYLTYTFSKNDFGTFLYILNLQSIILLISHLGISTLIVSDVPSILKKHNNCLFGYLVFCLLFVISTTTLITFVFLNILNISEKYFIYAFSFFLLTSINTLLGSFLVSLNKVLISNFIEFLVKNCIIFFLVIISYFFFLDLVILLKIYLFSNFIVMILLVMKLKKNFKNFDLDFKFDISKKLKRIFIIGYSIFFSAISARLDFFLIDYYYGKSYVAEFGLAVQILTIIYLPTQILHSITYPKISKLISEKKFNLLYIQINFTKIILAIYYFITLLFCYYFLEFLIDKIFPDNFQNINNVLIVLIFSNLICSLFFGSEFILHKQNFSNHVAFSFFLGLIINLCFGIILISKYGILGAAISTSIAMIMLHLILFIFFIKKNKKYQKSIFQILKLKKMIKKIFIFYR